ALHRFWGVLNPGVVRWISRQRYDAVLVYGWGRATNWLAMAAAVASRTPLLLRGESNLLNPVSPVKKLLKNFLLGPLFAATAGFLSIGRYNTEFYRNWGVPIDKIYLTPYAVDNDFWVAQSASLGPRKLQLKRELGLDSQIPVV